MSLRRTYESFAIEDLQRLLSETHTPRRRTVISTILAERGQPQLEWTSARRGWQWHAIGWEISRHRVTHGYFDQTIDVYRVWRERGKGHISEFMEECTDLPGAMAFVQAFVDDLKTKAAARPVERADMPEWPPIDLVLEDWCDDVHKEHEWTPGDLECRRCGADLSEWNDDAEKS